MPGTRQGGQRAALTNKQRYGENFYSVVGRLGGKISRGGGFTKDPELAREAGRKGGKAPHKYRGRAASNNKLNN